MTVEQQDAAVILRDVSQIIASIAEVPDEAVGPDVDIRQELGIDSLATVEILVTLQDKYHFKVADDDLKGLRTAGDIAGYVRQSTSLLT